MSYLQTALKVPKQELEQEENARQEINLVKKGMAKDRRSTLEATMDTIMLSARDRVIRIRNGKQTSPNKEIVSVESEIERLQHDVMNGRATLADFQAACDRWVVSHSK